MKTTRTTITALETTFDVDYWYSKGYPGSYWEPPEPADLEIEAIYIAGQSLQDLLRDDVLEAINDALEKQLIEQQKQYEEDRAQAEYEAWKERDLYIKDMMRSAK